MARRTKPSKHTSRSWDAVARWYAGWAGENGSDHHRNLAIPAVLDLLGPLAGARVLDVGCGPAAIAPHITRAGATYTGVDSSRKLLAAARRHYGDEGRFLHGDATRLTAIPDLGAAFDAVVFLLSIQDIDPLDAALEQAATVLRTGGRLVLLMTHPCFRVPRQSGWGWDSGRRLRFRRVDHYLTPLAVPMKQYADGRGTTRSYHRPLEDYVAALAGAGLMIDAVREIPTHRPPRPGPGARAERRANREIPLFMGLRAVKHA